MTKKYFMRKCDECLHAPASDDDACTRCLANMSYRAACRYRTAYFARLLAKLKQYTETPDEQWNPIYWMGS